MKISSGAIEGQGAVLVTGLGIVKGVTEGVFILRYGDPAFERMVEFYEQISPSLGNKPSADSLKDIRLAAAKYPKHACDGRVTTAVLDGALSVLKGTQSTDPAVAELIRTLTEAINGDARGIVEKLRALLAKFHRESASIPKPAAAPAGLTPLPALGAKGGAA